MLQGSAKVLFFPALLMAISSLADPTDLVINEILADPPDDANGDGVANTSQDEFVEIVNTGSANVDLGGFRLKDGFGIRHEFPSPTVLCSGQAIVIFGGGSPTGGFSGAVVQQASSGMLGLNNGGDTVTLEDDIGAFLTSVSYGSEGGQDQSLTRNPDLSGSFSQHTSVSSTAYSPGTKVDGTPFDACEPGEPTPSPTVSPTETPSLVMIHEIQGTKSNDGNGGDVSPLEGQLVVVEAIVVGAFLGADKLNGFFLQEEDDDMDNDPRSSEGIFVYYPVPVDGVNALNEGDKVLLAGKVAEYYSQTQLSNVIMIQVISSNNPLPTPAAIDFQKDSYGVFSTSGGYVADLERFEGMSVRFASNSDMVVNEIYNFVRYGELVLTDGMVPIQFSQSNFPSKSGYDFYLRSIAARQVTLDDGSTNQNPDLSTYPGLDGIFDTENAIRIGDRPDSDLVGCLGYSFSQYRVHPTGSFHFKREDHRPKLKRGAKGKKGEFSIVSANVLNYFVTLDENGNTSGPGDLEPRGADSAAEFDRQSEKLVTALLSLNSDIFGLLEIENDFGETSTGNAVKALVEKLNAAGKDTYDWVRPKQDGVDKTFVDTSDAISNAFIYKSSSFRVAGVNILTDSNIPVAFTDALPIFDGSGSNRATIAVTFEGNNDRRNLRDAIGHRSLSLFSQSSSDDGNDDRECITIALCHFKSKGSVSEGEGNQDAGDGAGNNNAIRLLASQAVAEWLKGNPTGVDCPNVMIMGDLNAYFKEDPVQYFLNNGYNSLVKEDEGSFVFDGYWGSLDYQLYNEDLFEKVKNFEKIQYNSFESLGLDYNLDFGRPSTWFDGSVPYRFSDHDPLVTTVKL